jgi:hypothetical protein
MIGFAQMENQKMRINKCKLCGSNEITLKKEVSCQGFGEYWAEWILKCKNCGCTLIFDTDNCTEEQAIERWNKLHG